MKANDTQVAGRHYKQFVIEPWDFVSLNSIGYLAGDAIVYIARYKEKNGIEDLRKAGHYINKLIELEEAKASDDPEVFRAYVQGLVKLPSADLDDVPSQATASPGVPAGTAGSPRTAAYADYIDRVLRGCADGPAVMPTPVAAAVPQPELSTLGQTELVGYYGSTGLWSSEVPRSDEDEEDEIGRQIQEAEILQEILAEEEAEIAREIQEDEIRQEILAEEEAEIGREIQEDEIRQEIRAEEELRELKVGENFGPIRPPIRVEGYTWPKF